MTTSAILKTLKSGNTAHLIRYQWKERGKVKQHHTVWLAPTRRDAVRQFTKANPHVTVL